MTTRKPRPVEGYVDFNDDDALRHLLNLSEPTLTMDMDHAPLSIESARHTMSKPDVYRHNGLELRRACSRIYVMVASGAPIALCIKEYFDRVGKFGGSHSALMASGYIGGTQQ